MLVKDVIYDIRVKIGDVNAVRFSDYDILAALNEANRVYYELCRTEAPGLIEIIHEGVIPPNVEHIELPPNTRLLKLYIQDHEVSPWKYDLVRYNGKPNLCVDKVQEERKYKLRLTESVKKLTLDSEIDVVDDLIGFFIDYASLMIGGGDAAQLAAATERQRTKLSSYVPLPPFVKGYYDD